jgi:hypothetical protein
MAASQGRGGHSGACGRRRAHSRAAWAAQTVKELGSRDTATTLRVKRLEQLIRSAEGVGLVAMARHDPPPFRS